LPVNLNASFLRRDSPRLEEPLLKNGLQNTHNDQDW